MSNAHFFFKNYKIIFLLGAIAIVVTCCKSTQTATSAKSSSAIAQLAPVKSDVAIARAHWPETTLNDLNQGYAIFGTKCTHCHAAKNPPEFTVIAWNSILHKMGRKANLDSNEYKLVLHFILTKRESMPGGDK